MLAGSARAAGTLVESALLPAILVSVIYWPGSRLFRILEWPPLLWVGRISYGMYLWQQFFFTPLRAVTISAAAEVFLPRLVLTFAAAIVSCYLLERPLLSYSRMVSTRFQSAPLVEVLGNNDMADSDLSAVLVMHKTADKFKKDSD